MNKSDMFIANKICVAIVNYVNNGTFNFSCSKCNLNQIRGTDYGSYLYLYPKFTANDIKIEEDKGWVYIRIISDNLEVDKFDMGLVYKEGTGASISHRLNETPYKLLKAEPIPGKGYDVLKFNIVSRKVIINPSERGGTTLVVTSSKIPIPIDNISRVLMELLPSSRSLNRDNPIVALFSYEMSYWTEVTFAKK